ncbi:hypothetical protein HMPREF0973_00134 [Prevotella veroralis F0319]|uniref:Uncharacterized protein n=1 Tax=Prevotella veroralis F0319 TaxID=649761 RepID=C9MKI4_9BACT|nr:hypothetical protein HMPREF0973_00134 [Prevotella veroralis F0319]
MVLFTPLFIRRGVGGEAVRDFGLIPLFLFCCHSCHPFEYSKSLVMS